MPAPEILDAVRAEHRTIAMMMDALEQETSALESNGAFDIDLVRLILRYMEDYPDRFHHPKEEALFDRAAARSADFATLVTTIRLEHVGMIPATRELGRTLDAIELGHNLWRDGVLAALRNYINRQRNHMTAENDTVFPALQGLLTDEDAAALDRRLASAFDPLEGGRDPGPYLRLKDIILSHVA